MTSDCQNIETQLADLAADRLTEAESERVRLHVASCAECQTSLKQLKLMRADLRSLPSPGPSEWFADRLAYQLRERQEQSFNPNRRAWPCALR